MNRTTRKQLESLATAINQATGSPLEPSTRDGNGTYRSNVGNFHISGAYGGYCLHRMANESGGVTTPLTSYHQPAKDCAAEMRAFLRGLEFAK